MHIYIYIYVCWKSCASAMFPACVHFGTRLLRRVGRNYVVRASVMCWSCVARRPCVVRLCVEIQFYCTGPCMHYVYMGASML